MRSKLLFVLVINTSLLFGCSSVKEDFSKYQSVSMQKADVMPSKSDLSGAKIKVVLFTPDHGSIDLAKNAKIGHSITSALNKYLSEAGVETVDRKIADKLQSELQLAESKGKSEYQGPDIADYAVNGEITNATISSTFTERFVYTNKDGKTSVTPAYCRFKAEVKGNLKLYELPALTYVKTISIDDWRSSKTETSNSRCPISKSALYSLLRTAAEESVKSSRIEFQTFLAPKAYVLEHRVFDGDSIFKISAGSSRGFKGGNEIEFYTTSKIKNALTGDTTIESYSVTDGEIVEGLTSPNHAWVTIGDEEEASKIKLGSLVKLHF